MGPRGHLSSWQGPRALAPRPGTAPRKANGAPLTAVVISSGSRLAPPHAVESGEAPNHPTGIQGPSPGLPGGAGQNNSPHCIPQQTKQFPKGWDPPESSTLPRKTILLLNQIGSLPNWTRFRVFPLILSGIDKKKEISYKDNTKPMFSTIAW